MDRLIHYRRMFNRVFAVSLWLGLLVPLQGQDISNAPAAEVRYILDAVPGAAGRSGTGYFTFAPWQDSGTNPVITVAGANGDVVGHQILWAAAGEPAKVLFDCSSGAKHYTVTERESGRALKSDWKPDAGLILETRALNDGPVRTWKEVRKTCEDAAPVLGRSLVPNIFLGVNPHAKTEDFISIFRGWIQIDQPGKHTFSVVCDDASSLFIDGKHVVSWAGLHGVSGPGRHGKFQEDVELKAGRHYLEYMNVEKGLEYTVVLGWKQPGQKHLSLVPSEAFPKVTEFSVGKVEMPAGNNMPVRFTWDIQRHLSAWGHYVVFMKLTALCEADQYSWNLDDGTVLKGREVSHMFLSPGLHKVKLTAAKSAVSSAGEREIMVHPLWRQLDETDQDYWGQIRKWILPRDFTNATHDDLLNILRMTSKMDDHGPAKNIAGICMKRLGEWGKNAPEVAMELGRYYQSIEVRDYAAAQRAYETVIQLPDTGRQLKASAQLALIVATLPVSNEPQQAQERLSAIDESLLTPEEKRIKIICEGDVLFAMGKPEAARSRYLQAGTGTNQNDTASALRRAAKLEMARDYNRRGEFNSAERVIAGMRIETPLERLNDEVGLVLLDACLGRNDFTRAYYLSRRLYQNGDSDSNRPALLYKLAESAFRMKANDEAQEALRKLYKEFPYSEAAARAREKWGAAVAEKK